MTGAQPHGRQEPCATPCTALQRPHSPYDDTAAPGATVNPHNMPRPGAPISAREVEVLQLVAEGQRNTQIAAALNLSPLTVKSHLVRIGRKLGHGTRAGMIGTAFRRGYLR